VTRHKRWITVLLFSFSAGGCSGEDDGSGGAGAQPDGSAGAGGQTVRDASDDGRRSPDGSGAGGAAGAADARGSAAAAGWDGTARPDAAADRDGAPGSDGSNADARADAVGADSPGADVSRADSFVDSPGIDWSIPPTGPDGPNAHAFNTATGALNVDYAGYLSKHDVTYNTPNTNPLYGLIVGNGRMGAMVWSVNGLTMQIGGVDTSPQGAFSSGLVNLSTAPGMDTGSTRFQQVLSLYDGTLTTTYDSNRTVTVMGSPNSEVMGIHVEDGRAGVTGVTVDISIWDLSTLTNSGDVPNLDTWKAVVTHADATGAGISRGQADPNNFGYTLAASVEGTTFTSQAMGANRVRLSIAPAPSYTIWITSATRLNARGHDSVAQAKTLLSGVQNAGYAATLVAYKTWWHDFWSKSFVQYASTSGADASTSGTDADYLENFYYLSTYAIAAGGYGNYPFHFINGVFRATQDNTKWSNAYWYWNQRNVYHSFLASNHAEIVAGFNNMYSRNLNALKAYTLTRYNIAGIWVPETMGWDGNARGTVGSDFTNDIYSTGVEAAANMYLQYAYTGDAAYLRDTVYPFMREAVTFYVGRLSYNSGTGLYYMATSNAHETYWDVPNAITDLAAVRSLFPAAIRVSQALGLDAALRAQWQNIVDHLAPYPTDATDYLPHDPPIAMTRNGENVACELIWPYDMTGIGAPDYQRAVSTWNHRPFPYGNVWANDAIHAARLGLGDAAYQGMKTMLGKYQNYPNGFTNNTNGVFEYFGAHLLAMNESMFQSYNDELRVFPALPNDAGFIGRFTLAAKGGFLASAEREVGEIKYLGIKSLHGNTATVINPWGTQEIQVRAEPGSSIVLTSSAAELSFPTVAGGVYIVERTAKPLSRYLYAHITGTRNRTPKRMSNPACTLGM
jgi:alpha-L-fucosidase 2